MERKRCWQLGSYTNPPPSRPLVSPEMCRPESCQQIHEAFGEKASTLVVVKPSNESNERYEMNLLLEYED